MTLPVVDWADFPDSAFLVFARSEGVWGDSLSYIVDNVDATRERFDLIFFEEINGQNIQVEDYRVSRKPQVDEMGRQLFIETAVNSVSDTFYVLNNPNTGTNPPPYEIIDEEVHSVAAQDAPGVGVKQTFALVLDKRPQKGTVKIYSKVGVAAEVLIATDYGAGVLSGADWEGEINYLTGAFILTEKVAGGDTLALATKILATYQFVTTGTLSGGADGDPITDAEIIRGWNLYRDRNKVDVEILVAGGISSPAVAAHMVGICESRKDCFSILDIDRTMQSPSNAIQWRKEDLSIYSQFARLYSPWLRVYDEDVAAEVGVPPSGSAAAAYVRMSNEGKRWEGCFGPQWGQLPWVRGFEYDYEEGEAALLYGDQINPIYDWPNYGPTIGGQKTTQAEPSPTDRANVNWYLIALYRRCKPLLDAFVGKLNVSSTRDSLRTALEAVGAEFRDDPTPACEEFIVICDLSNNPEYIRRQNRLVATIRTVPTSVGEYVELTAVITRNSADLA